MLLPRKGKHTTRHNSEAHATLKTKENFLLFSNRKRTRKTHCRIRAGVLRRRKHAAPPYGLAAANKRPRFVPPLPPHLFREFFPFVDLVKIFLSVCPDLQDGTRGHHGRHGRPVVPLEQAQPVQERGVLLRSPPSFVSPDPGGEMISFVSARDEGTCSVCAHTCLPGRLDDLGKRHH